MKKKLLVLLMAVTVAVSMMPVMAFAEETNLESAEAADLNATAELNEAEELNQTEAQLAEGEQDGDKLTKEIFVGGVMLEKKDTEYNNESKYTTQVLKKVKNKDGKYEYKLVDTDVYFKNAIKKGSVKYVSETNTLVLDGATIISGVVSQSGNVLNTRTCGIGTDSDLNIILKGENIIERGAVGTNSISAAISIFGDCTISGDGSLTVKKSTVSKGTAPDFSMGITGTNLLLLNSQRSLTTNSNMVFDDARVTVSCGELAAICGDNITFKGDSRIKCSSQGYINFMNRLTLSGIGIFGFKSINFNLTDGGSVYSSVSNSKAFGAVGVLSTDTVASTAEAGATINRADNNEYCNPFGGKNKAVAHNNSYLPGKYVVVVGNSSGSAAKTTEVIYAEAEQLISKVSLSTTKYTYNGKKHYPTVTVYAGGSAEPIASKVTASTENFSLSSITSNYKPGTYTVKATGTGIYKGYASASYTIAVKPTTIKSLTKASKAFTVKCAKQSSTYVSGYQLRYSTYSSMKSAKTVTVGTKSTAVSKKVSKLKSKKTYYVQVRTYKTVSGKKYYSDWSAKKSVKTR